MEGVGMLLFLCITMLIGSFVAGLVPLALSLSENKMRHITILGAGLLIGTALAVIIPEGIIALYADTSSPTSHGHIHKRSLDDQDAYAKFLYQQSEASNIQDTVRNQILSKRAASLSDEDMMRTFAFQRGETVNQNRVLAKRQMSDGGRLLNNDQEAMTLFLNQRAHNNNRNQVLDSSRTIVKRDLSDSWASDMFLRQKDHNNNLPIVRAKRDFNQDSNARTMFLQQQAHNNNVNQVIDSSTINSDRFKRSADLTDQEAIRLFLLQKDHNNNLPVVRAKRDFNQDSNAKTLFLYQQAHNNNVNQVLDKPNGNGRRLRRHVVSKRDTFQDLLDKQTFASRLAPNNNSRFKRDTDSDTDMLANRMFLLQKAHNNNQILVDKKRRLAKRDVEEEATGLLNDEAVNQLFLNQRTHNNNQNQVDDASARNLLNDDDQIDHHRQRVRRQAVNDPNQSNQMIHKVDGPIKVPDALHKEKENAMHHDDEHAHESKSIKNSHSAIGVTLVLGFVFMLIVDQIGGKVSHRHTPSLTDPQSIRSKISFVTTLGLVVHAAADGIALGAAAATSKTDVEMIVFAAIMLHKAPAAFGLVSFLMHEGLDRTRVRRHLTIFALAAPAMAILTFIILSAQSGVNVDSNSTGLCMLFSAGTFLYVSTVHVLPEVQAHNEDRQFRPSEMLSFIIGAVMPLFLSLGHSH